MSASADSGGAPSQESFDLGVLAGWARSAERLVCSWCGEDFDGDPENMGSDCCSCDLVPASSLPSIIQGLRAELDAAKERLGKVEDALR